MASSKKKKSIIENPDPAISEAILIRTREKELPCAVAFKLAEELKLSPAEIGAYADTHSIRLVKCQLGLFGYGEKKKVVTPPAEIPGKLKEAIENVVTGTDDPGRIGCSQVWDIAKGLSIPKLSAAGACEKMGLRIKPCQLGAF